MTVASFLMALLATISCNGTTSPSDSSLLDSTDSATQATPDSATPTDSQPATSPDVDNDGFPEDIDCDDSDPDVHPDALELCNEIDDDCDGDVDEDDASDAPLWYADGDGDGYGLTDEALTSCDRPRGYSEYPDDCDDDDPRVHPGAVEDACNDATDYNCDGSVGYADADGDLIPACEDCNDNDPYAFPDAPETCNDADDDCDGDVDEDAIDATTWYGDADGDGHGGKNFTDESCEPPDGYVETDDDCDDLDATSLPGGVEVCDDADNDCDDSTDEGVGITWYADDDGDGYGDVTQTTEACDWPADHASNPDDCDDSDPAAHPGGLEVCDAADNDCDGTVDNDALDATDWFEDSDSDGFGDPTTGTTACETPSSTHVSDDNDCDDDDGAVNPDALESCDEEDEDCDGAVDEDANDATTWYADRDADGYGDSDDSLEACDQPASYTANSEDCDDSDNDISPGATETCDTEDEDCDGTIDEDAVDPSTWHQDDDGDGYGDPDQTIDACEMPTDHVSDNSDCDDTRSDVNPLGVESCDEEDEDCDSAIDEEATDSTDWYDDSDNDGYGDPDTLVAQCEAPTGGVENDEDCDDTDDTVNPEATEQCDGVDNNCDGSLEDDATTLGSAEPCAANSCTEILGTRTDSPGDGTYWLDPTGTSPYEVHCDMQTSSGGWALLAVYTNSDSANWLPSGSNWISDSTLGDPTDPTTTSDAKSQAFNDLPVDELMVIHAPNSIGLISSTSCVGNQPLLTVFQQDSESDSNCAQSCGLNTVNSPWTGQSYQASSLYFRCADTDASYTDPGGYWYASDNSFLTTLDNNSYRDNNFGLGAGEDNNWVDWDQTTADGGDAGDSNPVLLFGR